MYPENLLALRVYQVLQSQWRVGMSGATGLDYGALPVVEDYLGIPRPQRRDVFEALQTIEYAYLSAVAERQAEKK